MSFAWATFLLVVPCASEWALVNIIRHAERSAEHSSQNMTLDVNRRAEYIARCVGSGTPCLAFPLGPPTKLLASLKTDKRALETLEPLAQKLHLPIDKKILHNSTKDFSEYLQQHVKSGDTLLVAWQHWLIPLLSKTLDPNGLADKSFPFPTQCSVRETIELTYTRDKCYDLITQMQLHRHNATTPWRIEAYTHMHMGFGGQAGSPCASAFVAHSNPSGWKMSAVVRVQKLHSGFWPNMYSPIALGIWCPALLIVLSWILLKIAKVKTLLEALDGLPLQISPRQDGLHLDVNPGHALEEPLLESRSNDDAVRPNESVRRLLLASSLIGMMLVLFVIIDPDMVHDFFFSLSGMLSVAFLFNFFAGGFSGVVTTTLTCPLENVKILMQTQDSIASIASGKVPRYTGLVDCFVRCYREQGLAYFWRGNLPNVMRYFPISAFNFAFKDAIEGRFPKYDPRTQFMQMLLVNLAAGGLAGAASLTIVYPLDYARTRLAGDLGKGYSDDLPRTTHDSANKREFAGLGDCLMKTIRSQGLFALYNGYTVSVVGIFMYRAPYFGLFDTLNSFNPYANVDNSTWGVYLCGLLISLIVGQVTSTIAAVISYPFDTVRRRLQMEADKPTECRKHKSALYCPCEIVATEGVGGLYKGFAANVLLGMCTAVMLVLFQEITHAAGTA